MGFLLRDEPLELSAKIVYTFIEEKINMNNSEICLENYFDFEGFERARLEKD